jgi:hypothetical protein
MGFRKGARKPKRAPRLMPRKPSGPEGPQPAPEGARKLRAELFAATLAAGAQNLAATGGRLACEKAVATGAHEIAGLKSPLHIILEIETRPCCATGLRTRPAYRRFISSLE